MQKLYFLKFKNLHEQEKNRLIEGFNGQRGITIMADLRTLCIEYDLPVPSCFQFEQEKTTNTWESQFLWKTVSNVEVRYEVSVAIVFKQEKIVAEDLKKLKMVIDGYSVGVRRGFIHGANRMLWY